MDFKVEFRNKVVNGDEVTFDVGLNFEGMGAPFETWDGTIQAYYDYFKYYGFSWNKAIIKDLDLTIQNNGYSTHNYNQAILTTAVVQNGAKVNSRFYNYGVFRFEWDNYSPAYAPPSLQSFYLNKGGYPTDDPTWDHVYTLSYAQVEMYNGGNPVYLEDGTQATGWFNPRATFFGQSHGSTATYKVFMKIKIVVQSGQSVPSNLRDMFYLGTPNNSMASTEFGTYQSPYQTDVVGTFYMSEEGGAPAAATPEMKFGYSPLYQLEADANAHAGGDGTSHSHVLDGVTYYMPNGLTMSVDQFHGTYGQLAQYDLDSDAADSVGSNDGSVTGASFVSDSGRDAINFDASGQKVEIPASLNIGSNGEYTYSAWIKLDDLSKRHVFLFDGVPGSTYQSLHIMALQTSGLVKVWHYTQNGTSGRQSFTSTGAMTPGQWQLLTVSWDGSNISVYLDGTLDSSGAMTATPWSSSNPYIIGDEGNPDAYVMGNVDDVRIYSRAMDADEVAYWYAETTVSEEAQSSESSYDWTHSGQLTNIVKFVQGQDLNGNRSYAYAKKEDDGSTTLYFTPDLTNFAAFGSYDSGASSIDGSPVFIEYGAGGKVAVGTDTGKVYQIELDAYSVPQGYTLLHDVVGGHPVNSLKYGYAMNVWIFEAGGDIYTIPAAGGGAVMRHTLPAGAKVVDFAEGDDGKVAFIVRLADFSLEPRVAPADWSVVYGPSSMVADAAVATDFNYSHAMDLWVSSNADGSAFTSVGDLLDFLS